MHELGQDKQPCFAWITNKPEREVDKKARPEDILILETV